jgi:CheY-like chemotaxis protein
MVEVDRGQFSQVIGNLAINAQQAMPEGGEISISAENVSVAPGSSLPLQSGNYVRVSVEDMGHGIRPEHLPKVFDPYFTTKQKGSGLGLATSYSIVNRHGGHIAVQSEFGRGTTFHVYLPASEKRKRAEKKADEVRPTIAGRILVMDDEPSIRRLASKMLRSFGHEVEQAADGKEALELYDQARQSGRPFDVVLMDLTIPGGMGGREAVKRLLEMDPGARAVVSSGYANTPLIADFEKYGFKSYLPKPYQLKQMKAVISDVLSDRE